MLTRADAKPLSIAAATAAGAGVVMGLWLTLPRDLAQPPAALDLQPIDALDPGLSSYRQTIAAAGVEAKPPPLVVAYDPLAGLPPEPDLVATRAAWRARDEDMEAAAERVREAAMSAELSSAASYRPWVEPAPDRFTGAVDESPVRP
jgi:hypothetical protein